MKDKIGYSYLLTSFLLAFERNGERDFTLASDGYGHKKIQGFYAGDYR